MNDVEWGKDVYLEDGNTWEHQDDPARLTPGLKYNQVLKHYADQVLQEANTYDLIDSVDIEMVYGTPDGGSRALKIPREILSGRKFPPWLSRNESDWCP